MAADTDLLSMPWRAEECTDEYREYCACLVVAGTGPAQHHIVADTDSPDIAARIVADHNAALGVKPTADMALAASLTERLTILQDGNEGAYRELYDAMNGPHFCPDRPFGQPATAEEAIA